MSDLELLEPAAKAAGMRYSANWNPLTDDGDALRLAVKLRLEVSPIEGDGVEITRWSAGAQEYYCVEWVGERDIHAATRRAIVRAAAEIGMVMP